MALTQAAYRFGSDTGTNETDHGWLANQNTAIYVGPGSHAGVDTPFLLRIGYQNDANAVSNINFTVQYKINAGSWVTITTTSAAVKAVAANVLTNNGNTTQRLTGFSGTFQGATGQAEDGDAGGPSMDIAASGCAEAVFGLQVNSAGVSNGDTITFQSLQEGSALAAYSVTPTLYIELSSSSPSSTPSSTSSTSQSLSPSRSPSTSSSLSASSSPSASIEPGSTFTVELREGTTLITSWSVSTLSLSLQTLTHDLTQGERDSITDWTALRYSFIADGDQVEVTWAELQVPASQGSSSSSTSSSLSPS